MDYSPESYEVTFTSGSTRQCTLIDIIDDRTPEPDEMFRVVITPDPDTDPGPNDNTTITIIDNGRYTMHSRYLQCYSSSLCFNTQMWSLDFSLCHTSLERIMELYQSLYQSLKEKLQLAKYLSDLRQVIQLLSVSTLTYSLL